MTKYSYRTRRSMSGKGIIVCLDYDGEEFESFQTRNQWRAHLKAKVKLRWYIFTDYIRYIW